MSEIDCKIAREEGLKKYLAQRKAGEIKLLNPLEKAKKNPKSMRAAINAKCWDCCCFQKKEIRLCPMTDCPLWNFRPYK